MKPYRKLSPRGWRMDGIVRPEMRGRWHSAERQNVMWSASEDRDLLAQWVMGARIQDIADWHQRSLGGISSRLSRLGARDLPKVLPCLA